MLKVGRKKKQKGRKTKSTCTQTRLPGFELALLGQPLASRAWSFTTQPRKQSTKHVRALNVMSGTITPPTVWKRNTSHTVTNAIKIKKKVTLIVQISFAEKNYSRKECDLPKHLFFNGRLSWCGIGAARLLKASRIFVAEKKKLFDREKSRSLSLIINCHRSRTRNIKKAAAWVLIGAKKGSLIYFFKSFYIYYIPHNYVIPQAMPHAIPQTHSAFYPHRSYFYHLKSVFTSIQPLSCYFAASHGVRVWVIFHTNIINY